MAHVTFALPARWLLSPALLLFALGCASLRPAPVPQRLPVAEQSAPPERLPAALPQEAPPVVPRQESPELEADGRRVRIVERARKLVGLRSLRRVSREVRDDCAGLVTFAYRAAGLSPWPRSVLPNENAVSAMFRESLTKGLIRVDTPRPGDLVFFRETYDRNRDGRINDGLTHVGVVESVDEAGTVSFVHRGHAGVERSRFNARFPQSRVADDGRLLNDFLRAATKTSRAYLAGELFEGYSALDRLAESTPRFAAAARRSAARGGESAPQ